MRKIYFLLFSLGYCSFDDLLSFLELCQIAGFVKIMVSLDQIREKVGKD